MLRLFLSSCRRIEERKIIKEWAAKRKFVRVHDCDESSNSLREKTKQDEYDHLIETETDLFIGIVNDHHAGKYTMHEIEVAYRQFLEKGAPVVMICCMKDTPCSIRMLYDPKDSALLVGPGSTISDRLNEIRRQAGLSGLPQNEEHFIDMYKYPEDPDFFAPYFANLMEVQIRKVLSENGGALRLKGLAKRGCEVTPGEIMGSRATPEMGFAPDLYYRWLNISIDPNRSVTIVTGRSGAGKSRMVYEFVRSEIADQNVVIVRKDNLHEVCDLVGDMDVKVAGPLYLVLDEVDKLMEHADGPCVGRIFSVCAVCDTIRVVATTVLDKRSLLGELEKEQTLPADFNWIHIPDLNEGNGEWDESLRDWLQKNFIQNKSCQSGKSIGYFIPQLHEYIQKQTDVLRANEQAIRFIAAYAVVSRYRKEEKQYLYTTAQMFRVLSRGEATWERHFIDGLNALCQLGCVSASRPVTVFDLSPSDPEPLDRQVAISVDDLLYEAFCRIVAEDRNYHFFLPRTAEQEWRCARLFLSIDEKNPLYYSRVLSRTCAASMPYIRERIGKLAGKHIFPGLQAPDDPDRGERMLFANIYLGRASSCEELEADFNLLCERYGFRPDTTTVSEIYRLALNTIYPEANEWYMQFAEQVIDPGSIEPDLYYCQRRTELCESFSQALPYAEMALKIISRQTPDCSDYEKANALKYKTVLMGKLATDEDVRSLRSLVEHYPDVRLLNYRSMLGIAVSCNMSVINAVINLFFETVDGVLNVRKCYWEVIEMDELNHRRFVGGFIANVIANMGLSYNSLERYFNRLGDGKYAPPLLCLLVRKCNTVEDARSFTRHLSHYLETTDSFHHGSVRIIFNNFIRHIPEKEMLDTTLALMEKYAIRKDVYTYNNLFFACVRWIERSRPAEEEWRGVLRGLFKQAAGEGVSLDQYSYASVCRLFDYAKSDDFRAVSDLFGLLDKPQPNIGERIRRNKAILSDWVRKANDWDEIRAITRDLIAQYREATHLEPDIFSAMLLWALERSADEAVRGQIRRLVDGFIERIDKDKYFYSLYIQLYISNDQVFDEAGKLHPIIEQAVMMPASLNKIALTVIIKLKGRPFAESRRFFEIVRLRARLTHEILSGYWFECFADNIGSEEDARYVGEVVDKYTKCVFKPKTLAAINEKLSRWISGGDSFVREKYYQTIGEYDPEMLNCKCHRSRRRELFEEYVCREKLDPHVIGNFLKLEAVNAVLDRVEQHRNRNAFYVWYTMQVMLRKKFLVDQYVYRAFKDAMLKRVPESYAELERLCDGDVKRCFFRYFHERTEEKKRPELIEFARLNGVEL